MFNFKTVVIDLETTDNPGDGRRIIELGAYYMDRQLQPEASMSFLVSDGADKLTPFVTELTGITAEMLNKGIILNDMLAEFEAGVGGENIKHWRLACWGNYFDINVLRQEYNRIQRPYPWSGTVIDVKSLALCWLALSGRRTDKAGLQSVARQMGIDKPEGDYSWHRALTDAFVTAQIYRRCVKDLGSGVWLQTPAKPYRYVEVR